MKTRMLKVICGDCAYTMRVARSWLLRAVPCCPLGHGVMEAPQFEQLCDEAMAEWQAEQRDTGAARTLTDKWITTRAPHTCSGCRDVMQHPDKMRHRVYVVEGEMLSEYTCLSCDARACGRTERGGARALARA